MELRAGVNAEVSSQAMACSAEAEGFPLLQACLCSLRRCVMVDPVSLSTPALSGMERPRSIPVRNNSSPIRRGRGLPMRNNKPSHSPRIHQRPRGGIMPSGTS